MQKYHTWDNKYFKITYNDEMIGVTLVSNSGREHGRIDRLYLHPDYHNKGFGSEVLKLIEIEFPKIKIWTLETMVQSSRNLEFYKKNGYELIAEDEEDRFFRKTIGEEVYSKDEFVFDGDLSGKNYRECNMERSDFYDSNLSKSRYSDINISESIFQNTNVQKARFTNVNMKETVFGDSNLRNIEICHSTLSGTHIHDVNLDVSEGESSVIIERSRLVNSKIKESNLKGVSIENCDIQGMTIDGIDISKMIEFYKNNK